MQLVINQRGNLLRVVGDVPVASVREDITPSSVASTMNLIEQQSGASIRVTQLWGDSMVHFFSVLSVLTNPIPALAFYVHATCPQAGAPNALSETDFSGLLTPWMAYDSYSCWVLMEAYHGGLSWRPIVEAYCPL